MTLSLPAWLTCPPFTCFLQGATESSEQVTPDGDGSLRTAKVLFKDTNMG